MTKLEVQRKDLAGLGRNQRLLLNAENAEVFAEARKASPLRSFAQTFAFSPLKRILSLRPAGCFFAASFAIVFFAGLGSLSAAEAASAHRIELQERVIVPEEGLLLGNGDLSVSVYQTADRVIWRFGKGDVWDRRLDLSDDPKPAHIDEIARGIRDEGWKCGPYGGPVEATRGTKNPERMRELCQGAPPSYTRRPYPCPKPVGELALHLPPDLPGLKLTQQLLIEEATLRVTCAWPSGVRIEIESFIPPSNNVLVVRWRVENWNEQTRMGQQPPVWFSLYRWADPTIQTFAARVFAECRHDAFQLACDPKVTPLPPPVVQQEDKWRHIEQSFPPDALFPQGFRCLLAPFATDVAVEHANTAAAGEARLHLLPKAGATEGKLAVVVATSSDAGGPLAELQRLRSQWADQPARLLDRWTAENRNAAREFWSRSELRIADPLLEDLWYETLHARRCAYRRGTVPPGLFLPSTVQDYSHWHGDYHLNYNFQEPFWGDYTANHLELGDAYFDGIAFMLPIGRKIARDYYGCRGTFIQLSMYPMQPPDDPLGVVPMGRMAYMTGWVINQYWWRYLHTLDREWLRATGYPVIRDCALFYTDFMKKGADGFYHVFPSNQGEDGFTGDSKDYTDRSQVMRHLRYCLRAAVRASEVLGVDEELRVTWRERLENTAGNNGKPIVKLEGLEKECAEANPPEFGAGRPYRPQPANPAGTPWPPPNDGAFVWYYGQYPWFAMRRLRAGDFVAEQDLPVFRRLVERWRRPNGVLGGMSVASYGRAGAWTESLGVIAPLQEMMLQSWDGALRIFPAWPRTLEASFKHFRAEGAFLVSATWSQGRVTRLDVKSEKGAACALYPPWPGTMRIVDQAGQAVPVDKDRFGRLVFSTVAGNTYTISAG